MSLLQNFGLLNDATSNAHLDELFVDANGKFYEAVHAQGGSKAEQERTVGAFVKAANLLSPDLKEWEYKQIYSKGFYTPSLGVKASLLYETSEKQLAQMKEDGKLGNIFHSVVSCFVGSGSPSNPAPV